VSDPDAPPLEIEAIVAALDQHEVAYVLVGGLGARFHGATRLTRDFDLCAETSRTNLDRLAAALRDLDAKLRGLPEDVHAPVHAELLSRMELAAWRTSAGDVDVLLGIPAGRMADLRRYPELVARAVVVEVAGFQVRVAALEDIIASKEAANRQPDREALVELRALAQRARRPLQQPEGPTFGL